MIDAAFVELAPLTSTATACALLGKARATHYRAQRPAVPRPRATRPVPPNALTESERAAILDVLNSARFADKSVAQAWATLLDEGIYLASRSTMHRVLRAAGCSRERRRQATHPARAKPELLATGPGQVWSWDIERHEAPATEWR